MYIYIYIYIYIYSPIILYASTAAIFKIYSNVDCIVCFITILLLFDILIYIYIYIYINGSISVSIQLFDILIYPLID